MKRKDKTVLKSVNFHGEGICVDFFLRLDGTFGFEEYRRDFEDARGWFPIGNYENLVFKDITSAEEAAQNTVVWLNLEL